MQELVYRSWDARSGCSAGMWCRAVAPGCGAGAPEPPAVPGAAAGGSRPRAPSAGTAPARGEPASGSENCVLQAL